MVAFDADFLTLLLNPNAKPPKDPRNDKPVNNAKSKIDHFILKLEKTHDRILIPASALSEVLTLGLDLASDYLSELNDAHRFEIAPFDTMAAVEAAIATIHAKQRGGKKGGSDSTWAKIKFDRQIVAIAKVKKVTAIYSNDTDVHTMARLENIPVYGVWDLPDPPAEQIPIDYQPPEQPKTETK